MWFFLCSFLIKVLKITLKSVESNTLRAIIMVSGKLIRKRGKQK